MSNEVHTAPIQQLEDESEPLPRRARASRERGRAKTKSDAVVALLSRSRGSTIDEMMHATGWQAHSVRGFIAGSVKKRLGRSVTSEVSAKGRVYRIIAEVS